VVATRKKSWRLDGSNLDRQRDWLGVSNYGVYFISSAAADRLRSVAYRFALKGVEWLHWPCLPGRRPRPNGIDAPPNAREMRD
jgi:hypothetical protein